MAEMKKMVCTSDHWRKREEGKGVHRERNRQFRASGLRFTGFSTCREGVSGA